MMKKLLLFCGILLISGCAQYMPNATFLQTKPAIQTAKESAVYYQTHEREFSPEQRDTFAAENARAWTAMDNLFELPQ
jgi:hypothetical protein